MEALVHCTSSEWPLYEADQSLTGTANVLFEYVWTNCALCVQLCFFVGHYRSLAIVVCANGCVFIVGHFTLV